MLIMSSFFFGKKSAQSKVDYKSRLEYKLYLAREDPEPLFDLSECGLKTVPTGIYSLCKVFRKEKLLLQINRLTSLSGGGVLTDLCLVTVLHLQNNQFSSLPEDIVHLKNLKELNVSNNVLKKLPDSIGSLAKLRVLDCSHNKLQSLPTSFGQLHSLATLDLRDNPGIFIFPPCLIQLKGLVELLVDQQLLKDVPSDILQQGVSAILEFYDKEKTGTKLCCEEEKMEAPDTPKKSSSTLQENQDKQSFAQVSLMLLEKRKQEKAEDLLKIEKQLQKQRETEFELHQNTKQDKNKLLLDLRDQQKKLENDVCKFQTEKDKEKTKLLNYLIRAENQTEETFKDLLALRQALRADHWQERELRGHQELEDQGIRSGELRRREVLDSMVSMLKEEFAWNEKLLAYEKAKKEIIQSSLYMEVESSERLNSLLYERASRNRQLVSAVEADSEVQKALVATLLEQTDLRSQALLMQVSLVHQELAWLTDLELKRRSLDAEQHVLDLEEKRQTLSNLLVNLMQEQRERQRHLVESLHNLEGNEVVSADSEDFWLRQYQRLMATRPSHLTSSLDPRLLHLLVLRRVAHHLPCLLYHPLEQLTPHSLTQIGITNEEEQLAILDAVNAYLMHKQEEVAPSAPPYPLEAAGTETATLKESLPECVVCMEKQCAIVFVPCGHLCVCLACATQLLLCPLCRAPLERKIHAIVP